MLARFFFDLQNDKEVIRDEEGVEADNADQAIQQAIAELDEMRRTGELTGMEVGWTLIVRDAEGVELRRLII